MSAKAEPSDDLRRPRGRPRTEDLKGLEARLLLEARKLFFERGYGATTMSDVADAARASKTTLYARYPSKAALLHAIVAEQIDSWGSGVYSVPMDHGTLEETL